MKRLLALSALALAIGASPAYAILNGVPDGSDHPYVGMATGSGRLCSGTRISPHRFLTAAHCFPAGSTVSIIFDPDARAATKVFSGTFFPSRDNDVAIVVVHQKMRPPYASLPALGSVAELPMKQAVTSVGYGIRVPVKDVEDEYAVRYQATSELIQSDGALSGQYIKLSANPAQDKGGVCFGDSGGPTLLGDTIVGVTSFGTNANCAGVTYAQRIDIAPARRFIDSFGS